MKKMFEDHEGNLSSFRVVWAISVLTIVFTWAIVGVKAGIMQPWPMDGLTTVGLFGGPGLKTATERLKSQGKET